MLPKLLAGVLLVVVLAAVATFSAVYYMDFSGAAAEPAACDHQATAVSPDDGPCCGDLTKIRGHGLQPAQFDGPANDSK